MYVNNKYIGIYLTLKIKKAANETSITNSYK